MGLACSWDHVVWPKDPHSDVPLFRIATGSYGLGFIDRTGRVVIPPQYWTGGNHGDDDFFSNRARVQTKDGVWYIDAEGNRYKAAGGRFSEGLAPVEDRTTHKFGFIDVHGRLAIPYKFDLVRGFHNGLAIAVQHDRYGVIDKSGKWVAPPKFVDADDFSNGIAWVVEAGPCIRLRTGPCEQPRAVPVFEGGVYRQPPLPAKTDCVMTAIDTTGRVLFRGDFHSVRPFSGGLAAVEKAGKWGYIDRTGKVRIPLRFTQAYPFSEGLALVRNEVQQGSKAGFIDTTGRVVIPFRYLNGERFSEGLAVTIEEDTADPYHHWIYRYIDRQGRVVLPGPYDGASSFVFGLAHVRVGKDFNKATWKWIDKTGKAVYTYETKLD